VTAGSRDEYDNAGQSKEQIVCVSLHVSAVMLANAFKGQGEEKRGNERGEIFLLPDFLALDCRLYIYFCSREMWTDRQRDKVAEISNRHYILFVFVIAIVVTITLQSYRIKCADYVHD